MNRYSDIDPQDMDPDTGRPYSNYSSPSLDTSFHDAEMAGEDDEPDDPLDLLRELVAAFPPTLHRNGRQVAALAAARALIAGA